MKDRQQQTKQQDTQHRQREFEADLDSENFVPSILFRRFLLWDEDGARNWSVILSKVCNVDLELR